MRHKIAYVAFGLMVFAPGAVFAQEALPYDNGLATYHTAPRYRASEEHPLRVMAYVVHPIGWLTREVIFRPISYFASSTETTRSVMGFREPFDYRQPECFSADDSVPDCRSLAPFNYEGSKFGGEGADAAADSTGSMVGDSSNMVYFPDVNFDFDKKQLNDLGQGRARQISQLLAKNQNLTVVLQGYADYKGTEQYNEKLGMDRADAVRQELVNLGVDASRLSTVSFGEAQPIFSEETNWARAVNRRVEIHVSEGNS